MTFARLKLDQAVLRQTAGKTVIVLQAFPAKTTVGAATRVKAAKALCGQKTPVRML